MFSLSSACSDWMLGDKLGNAVKKKEGRNQFEVSEIRSCTVLCVRAVGYLEGEGERPISSGLEN